MADDLLPTELASRIDFLCQQFERACQRGETPSIDDFVSQAEASDRGALRRELVAIETAYREKLARRAPPGMAKGNGPPTTRVPDKTLVSVKGDADGTPIEPDGTDLTGSWRPAETPGVDKGDWYISRAGVKQGPAQSALSPSVEAIAGYEILGLLGRGGMGVVYQARQPGLKRIVALKMILEGGLATPQELARFRAEAEVVARFQHPNIVQIYEVGDDNGCPYFSLEYVDGPTLRKQLDGQPVPQLQAAALVETLALAIAYAHKRSIVHRDLKPANILLTSDGVPKIADFGLAKTLDIDGGQTESGAILGTPDYMAPEQAAGKIDQVGPPADIYALGTILYELLIGRPPFKSANVMDTLQQIITKEPVPPKQLDPKIHRDLETIVLQCLNKEPSKRYARADELAEDLRRFQAGHVILARPAGTAERAWRWCRRNPRVAILCGVVASLVLIWAGTASGMAWWLKLEQDATDAAKQLAQQNEQKANKNAETAIKNEGVAKNNEIAAKKQYELAVLLLLELGSQLETRLQEKRGLEEPAELRAVHKDIVHVVGEAMKKLSMQLTDSNVPNFAMVNASNQVGELLFRFGHAEEALRQFEHGYQLVSQILEQSPDDEYARGNAALMLIQMGRMYLEINDDAKTARQLFVKAHAFQQSLADDARPNAKYTAIDHARLLAQSEVHIGIADLHLGQPAEALKSFQVARAHREAWAVAEPNNISARSLLSEVQWNLGMVAWRLNDFEASQGHYRKALTVNHDLATKRPADFSIQVDLADIYGDYSEAKLRMGKVDDARITATKSLEFLQAALAHEPDLISRQALLPLAYERLARVALKKGEPDEARRLFDEACEIRNKLVLVDPQNQSWKLALALTLAHCGDASAAARQAQEVIDKSPDNIGMLLQAARTWAVCAASVQDATERQSLRQRAVSALRKATTGEFRDAVLIETDPELSLLGDDADYAAMLAEIKARQQPPEGEVQREDTA